MAPLTSGSTSPETAAHILLKGLTMKYFDKFNFVFIVNKSY